MTIRTTLAASIAALSLGIAGIGAAAPAQAAQSPAECMAALPAYSMTDTSPGDADDHMDAVFACEDQAGAKASGAAMHTGPVAAPRAQAVDTINGSAT